MSTQDVCDILWARHKLEHNKIFTKEVDAARFEIFQGTHLMIQSHNDEKANTYLCQHNHFSTWV